MTMYYNYSLLFPCLLLCFTTSFAAEISNGFTIDLIHRDSLQSPLHNPSLQTKWKRLTNAFRRSTSRVDRFKQSKASQTDIQSPVLVAGGEYLMNLSIGTPPIPVLGIADTGSDLIWTQCKPCVQCYDQKPPIFDPKRSSSYENLPCQSNACHSIGTSTCNMGTCSYYYAYGDRSHTNGDLAAETISFGGPTTFPNIVVGCGHDNGGTFNKMGSGLIGLGGGSLSLVSQLPKPVGGRFAYCLVPSSNTSTTSKISFGANAIVSDGPGVFSTPLVRKNPSTFYYLTLESISIGDQTLKYKTTKVGEFMGSKDFRGEKGNIIIDSGTTLTILPEEFYSDLEAALEKAIEGERADDPQGILSLCYRGDGDDLKIPIIKAKFEGGGLELKPSNTFVRVQENVVCFAMRGASDVAIFGNLSQMDFLVSYDLEEGKVSFKPMDCSKYE